MDREPTIKHNPDNEFFPESLRGFFPEATSSREVWSEYVSNAVAYLSVELRNIDPESPAQQAAMNLAGALNIISQRLQSVDVQFSKVEIANTLQQQKELWKAFVNASTDAEGGNAPESTRGPDRSRPPTGMSVRVRQHMGAQALTRQPQGAHRAAAMQDDEDVAPVGDADNVLSPDEEAALVAELRAIEAQDDDVSDVAQSDRDISNTEDPDGSDVQEPDGNRRRSAIAHLRAAVAAAREDRPKGADADAEPPGPGGEPLVLSDPISAAEHSGEGDGATPDSGVPEAEPDGVPPRPKRKSTMRDAESDQPTNSAEGAEDSAELLQTLNTAEEEYWDLWQARNGKSKLGKWKDRKVDKEALGVAEQKFQAAREAYVNAHKERIEADESLRAQAAEAAVIGPVLRKLQIERGVLPKDAEGVLSKTLEILNRPTKGSRMVSWLSQKAEVLGALVVAGGGAALQQYGIELPQQSYSGAVVGAFLGAKVGRRVSAVQNKIASKFQTPEKMMASTIDKTKQKFNPDDIDSYAEKINKRARRIKKPHAFSEMRSVLTGITTGAALGALLGNELANAEAVSSLLEAKEVLLADVLDSAREGVSEDRIQAFVDAVFDSSRSAEDRLSFLGQQIDSGAIERGTVEKIAPFITAE